jgi:hypothetical protein
MRDLDGGDVTTDGFSVVGAAKTDMLLLRNEKGNGERRALARGGGRT